MPAMPPIPTISDAPGCHVHATAEQSIAQNTYVSITFAVEDYDSHGFWESGQPSRFTIPAGQAGRYGFRAHGHLTTDATAGAYDLYVRSNGATYLSAARLDASDSAAGGVFEVAWEGALASGDYVEVVAYQNVVASKQYGYPATPWWMQASLTRLAVGNPGPQGPPGTAHATSGLVFPATQVPSADANTFDDYEEGTFTPGVAFGGGTTGITYTIQVGVYTKKGREVSCSITVRLSDNGSSTGAMTITGLPFASANVADQYHSATIGYYADLVAGYGTLSGIIDPGASVIRMFTGNTGTSVLTMTDVATTNTTFLILSVTYSV
jgi:hypothetical protein